MILTTSGSTTIEARWDPWPSFIILDLALGIFIRWERIHLYQAEKESYPLDDQGRPGLDHVIRTNTLPSFCSGQCIPVFEWLIVQPRQVPLGRGSTVGWPHDGQASLSHLSPSFFHIPFFFFFFLARLTTTCKAQSRSKPCIFGNPLSMGHTQCSLLRSKGFWWCAGKCIGDRDVDATQTCRAKRDVGRMGWRLEIMGITSGHEFVVWKRRLECQGEFSEVEAILFHWAVVKLCFGRSRDGNSLFFGVAVAGRDRVSKFLIETHAVVVRELPRLVRDSSHWVLSYRCSLTDWISHSSDMRSLVSKFPQIS